MNAAMSKVRAKRQKKATPPLWQPCYSIVLEQLFLGYMDASSGLYGQLVVIRL
jgi:hypothetical protein